MGKKGEFKRIAVLAIMMFFGMKIVGAYAVLPTMDQSKESEHAESQSTETHENKAEDDKNENKKQEAKNTGYGPFSTGDLFMDIISGDRFGKNYQQMLEKYAGELLKSQQIKSKKKKEELERQQEMRDKLREEEKEKEKAEKEIKSEREAKPKKKWYNWYKSSKK